MVVWWVAGSSLHSQHGVPSYCLRLFMTIAIPHITHVFSCAALPLESSCSFWLGPATDTQARFRAYGTVPTPQLYNTPPSLTTPPVDLISALQGGRIVAVSDANFSPPGNLLLPGRGVDMSDGWETRRSQVGRGKYAAGQPLAGKERMEWVIVRFGAGGRGVVRYVEIDTAFHPGNYPVVSYSLLSV